MKEALELMKVCMADATRKLKAATGKNFDVSLDIRNGVLRWSVGNAGMWYFADCMCDDPTNMDSFISEVIKRHEADVKSEIEKLKNKLASLEGAE